MKSNLNRVVRAVLGTAALASALLLAACGGGEQATTFVAARVLAFGDESSVIDSDGSKYSVNALLTGTSTLDCGANPLWIQSVAGLYGLRFPQCPGTALSPTSRIYAANGASVADLTAQIDQFEANGGFVTGDLATVLVGAHDVIAQFAQYPGVGEAQLLANVDAAGRLLAAQVNRLAVLGVKVLVATIPDVGLMPYAGDRTAGSTNPNPAILSRLSTRLNDAMLANLTNDGRKIGLVQLDEYLQASDTATRLGGGSFANTTVASCSVALPRCTTGTLVAGAVNAVWLWADDRRMSGFGQSSLGSLAVTRAQNNPF